MHEKQAVGGQNNITQVTVTIAQQSHGVYFPFNKRAFNECVRVYFKMKCNKNGRSGGRGEGG